MGPFCYRKKTEDKKGIVYELPLEKIIFLKNIVYTTKHPTARSWFKKKGSVFVPMFYICLHTCGLM